MRGSPENGSKMLLELFYHLNNPILGQHKFGLYFSFVSFFSFYIIFENGEKNHLLYLSSRQGLIIEDQE